MFTPSFSVKVVAWRVVFISFLDYDMSTISIIPPTPLSCRFYSNWVSSWSSCYQVSHKECFEDVITKKLINCILNLGEKKGVQSLGNRPSDEKYSVHSKI